MGSLGELFDKVKKTVGYKSSGVKLNFANDLWAALESNSMKSKDLADKIKKTPPYVSKVFRGEENLTIDTMVRLADAVDCDLKIKLARRAFAQNSIDSWADSSDSDIYEITRSNLKITGSIKNIANDESWKTNPSGLDQAIA